MTKDQFINAVKDEQNSLRGFLLALCCGNRDEADDIAQDALVKAYLSIDRYVDKGQFHSWIFKIAYNTFINHRSASRQFDSLDEARSEIGSYVADGSFEYQQLYLALSTLPAGLRSALTLYYINGYSIKEVAVITSSSEDAVKKQLSRGREKLKDIISR